MDSLYPLVIDALTCKYIAKKIKTFTACVKRTEINRFGDPGISRRILYSCLKATIGSTLAAFMAG